jgi:hypothetical protein
VCTAHLESRDFDGFSPPLRKAQLAKMFRLLDDREDDDQVELRVITGDFNFPAGSQEEVVTTVPRAVAVLFSVFF